MADSYTAALRLVKPEVGASEDLWGASLDAAMDMVDEAVGGYVAISVASGDVTLSTNNNATDQARNAVIKFTGSPGTDRTITAPVVEKTYWLINGVGDSSNILFKATGGSAVTIPAGYSAKVYTDGTTTAVILFLITTGGTGASGPGAGQIKFPATQNPSSDVNTLDDYEEGTFTPGVTFGGASVGMTFSQQVGTYIKIGRQVFVSAAFTFTAKGSSTGAFLLTGLPFASLNGNAFGGISIWSYTNLNSITSIFGNVTRNDTTVGLSNFGAANSTALDNTSFNNSSSIVLSAVYYAAA